MSYVTDAEAQAYNSRFYKRTKNRSYIPRGKGWTTFLYPFANDYFTFGSGTLQRNFRDKPIQGFRFGKTPGIYPTKDNPRISVEQERGFDYLHRTGEYQRRYVIPKWSLPLWNEWFGRSPWPSEYQPPRWYTWILRLWRWFGPRYNGRPTPIPNFIAQHADCIHNEYVQRIRQGTPKRTAFIQATKRCTSFNQSLSGNFHSRHRRGYRSFVHRNRYTYQ